ncbi:ribonuclease Y [bacterium]|nr:ribonuclease Y [bacterium]
MIIISTVGFSSWLAWLFGVASNVYLIGGLALLAGILLGYLGGRLVARSRLRSSEEQAKRIVADAIRDAKQEKERRILEIKDEQLRSRAEFEKETRESRREIRMLEKRIQQREEILDRKVEVLEKKEEGVASKSKNLRKKEGALSKREEELKVLEEQASNQLQRLSGLSRQEAREILLSRVREQVQSDAAALVRRIETEAREKADKVAKNIIAQAIQRSASDHVGEATVSTVALPNDEMKGRIIGREGRNIRCLEAATGIDVIIDDTPEAVVLSGFDAVRKEVAKISLERLMLDGRIHPARIEEVVAKVKKEVDTAIREAGEQAAFDVGIHNLHPELIRLLGRLKFRTSYGQNVLHHSVEVARLMGMMAGELGVDIRMAKRAGLLHDIGKAASHEVEGAHAQIGADFAKRYREHPIVVNAVAAHHMEEEARSIIAVLAQAADSLSAARPGARSETLEIYIKRLERLEGIANSYPGIDRAYAIQAGREVRVIVHPDKVSDDQVLLLSRELAKNIEKELDYPGQVKVTVIRETRAVEFAR